MTMQRPCHIALLFAFALLISAVSPLSSKAETSKPNILWIYAEDTSPWMGCYGDKVNKDHTPHIDSIASRGVRFARAFVPAPVCSSTRSAMMIGQSGIRVNVHEHRSSRGAGNEIELPAHYKLLPEIMQEHGYSTFNFGKTDYNFVRDLNKTFTHKGGATKKSRGKKGKKQKSETPVQQVQPAAKNRFTALVDKQPFFGQIQTKGGKTNTSKIGKLKTSSDQVTVPADYPDEPLFQKWVAQHYDAIRLEDIAVGKILSELKASGMMQNTIVVYFSDHGANNLLRHKQMPTEGGLHVPFAIMGPEKYVPVAQKIRNDLVNMLDLSATTLAWAGIPQPQWYEGQPLFADNFKPRDAVFSHKDRLDFTIDRVRTVRTDRFRYTRNYKLDRIFLQPQYRDPRDFTQRMRELYKLGQLSPRHAEIYFGERPYEEFYDASADPAQMKDLTNDPAYQEELNRHRKLLDDWLAKGDRGVGDEPQGELRVNGEEIKGGRGVNMEYEVWRTDSDGDGLSDKWEKINKRDPSDGLLQFEFNCGAWQTEGWQAHNINNNIAGYLGYLNFKLDKGEGSIKRDGLKLKTVKADRSLTIFAKASAPTQATVLINGKQLGGIKLSASQDASQYILPLKKNDIWPEEVNRIEIQFSADKNTEIELDYIKVSRQ